MTSTTFVDKQTVIQAAWLNDVNTKTYADSSDTVAYTPAGTGAVATTVQTKLRERVSIKDFGAVGDGVTDDYAAFMAAYNALPVTGGVIGLGRGTFLHNTKITISKNVTLRGEGSSIVSGTVGPTELIKGAGIAGNGLELVGDGAAIESLNYRGAVGNTGDGIAVIGGRQIVRDVSVYTMGNDGIRIGTDAGTSNCNLWLLENVRAKNNGGNGLTISDSTTPLVASDANAGTLLHADLQSNTGHGLYLGNTALNSFFGLNTQSNTLNGVNLTANAQYNMFFGGDNEANTLDELRIDSGAYRNSFIGVTISGTPVDLGTGTSFAACTGLGAPAGMKFPNINDTNLKVLDWYEEGTFTPIFEGTTTPGTGTYSTQVGNFTRIGNLVRISISLRATAHTGTGNLIITGLPYPSAASPKGRANLSLNCQLLTYGAGIPYAYINDASSSIILNLQTSNAAATSIAMDVDAWVFVEGTYQV